MDTTLFMGRSLGDETSAIDYLLPNDGLFVNQLLLLLLRYGSRGTAINPEPENVPIIKEGDQHVSNFSLITLFSQLLTFLPICYLGLF